MLTGWPVVVHSARTAVAAVASVLVARLFRLPEAYWAPITTLVITQSSLGAAFTVSRQRFVGTAIGAVVGGIVASHFGPQVLVFCMAVFILGLLCAVAHADRSAHRFGALRWRSCFWCRGRVLHGRSPFTGSSKCPSELGWR